MFTKENEIKRDKCWDSPDGRQIISYYCHGQHGNQEFVYMEVGNTYFRYINFLVLCNNNGTRTRVIF